jgi:hypothetical protein
MDLKFVIFIYHGLRPKPKSKTKKFTEVWKYMKYELEYEVSFPSY